MKENVSGCVPGPELMGLRTEPALKTTTLFSNRPLREGTIPSPVFSWRMRTTQRFGR